MGITKLIYALLITIAPITELRAGLPLAISWAIENSVPIIPVFILVVLLNVLVIFFIFFFLDKIHRVLLKFKTYENLFGIWLEKFRKKVDKFEKRYNEIGFWALVLFVAVPLPGTGAWSGCLVSWLLGLDRKKSIFAIALGVFIAGLIILLGALGIIYLL